MSDASLTPCFLGPCGNLDALPEALIVEFLHDHVCWRRDVHPQDPPTSPTAAAQQPSADLHGAPEARAAQPVGGVPALATVPQPAPRRQQGVQRAALPPTLPLLNPLEPRLGRARS